MAYVKKFKNIFIGILKRFSSTLNPNDFPSLSIYLDEIFKKSKKQILREFTLSDVQKSHKHNDKHITEVTLIDIQMFTPEKEEVYLKILKEIDITSEDLKHIEIKRIDLYNKYNNIINEAKKLKDSEFDRKMLDSKINEIVNQEELSDIKKYKNNSSLTNSYGIIYRK